MIYKEDQRFLGYSHGSPHIFPFDMYDSTLLKAASGELHPEIETYIRNAKPIPGKNILLIDALGAGEIWGSNVNGDFYGRDELMNNEQNAGFRSFMYHAYPYKHHQNEARKKDPNRRYGERVPLSVYFEPMDRVQLIAIVDASPDRAGDIVSRVDKGEYPDVSMACSVAYDKCSICGSIHRTKADYCKHARDQLNYIRPDGQKVFLYNIRPKFHDISFVFIGADRSAKVLRKVASIQQQRQELNIPDFYVKRVSGGRPISSANPKKAVIHKKFPLDDIKISKVARAYTKMASLRETDIPVDILSKLSSFPIEDVIETANHFAIALKPHEFQYLAVANGGNEKRASDLHNARIVFDLNTFSDPNFYSLPQGSFDNKIASVLKEVLFDRSGLTPFIMERLKSDHLGNKVASAVPPFRSMVWPTLAGLYVGYKKKIPESLKSIIGKGMREISPHIAPMAMGALAYHSMQAGRDYAYEHPLIEDDIDNDELHVFNNYSMDNSFPDEKQSSIPVIYMLSSSLRNDKEAGLSLSMSKEFIKQYSLINDLINV